MKALACEMCGSKDILKQDGVFVCQHCGMKYSAEEAKKMMVEGTVSVQGDIQVTNAAKVENLISLARSSFASKNYAQAEEFCNQILAMDGAHYEAWKLKGEAINYQITGQNDRITEVYNCIMTSYRILDDKNKAIHRDEILASLRTCLEGEIDFVLQLFMTNRPTDSMLEKVKKSFVQCAANVITSYQKLGFSEGEADAYRTYIKNYFIRKVNTTCEKTWREVVYYNYWRDGWTDDYHPNAEIMKTYIEEGDNLVELLQFAETYFTEKTPLDQKKENYRLQNDIQSHIVGAVSYKRMVHTTTNGYGAVIKRYEYWGHDKSLTEEAKALRQKDIEKSAKLFDQVEKEMAKNDPAFREKLIKEWKAKIDSINTPYRMDLLGILGITFAICAILCFTVITNWLNNYDAGVAGTVTGVIGGIAAILCLAFECRDAIADRKSKQEEIARYEQKIRDIS